MKLAAWKEVVMAVVLAMSMVILPLAPSIDAQQRSPITEPRAVDTDDDGFPWSLLGLLGLIGLAGLRRHPVVDRRSTNDPTQRWP